MFVFRKEDGWWKQVHIRERLDMGSKMVDPAH